MKLFILLALLATSAFSAETKTECPWMKEMNSRSNPKANMKMEVSKLKVESKSSSVRGQ